MRCVLKIAGLSLLALSFVSQSFSAAYNSKAYHRCMEKCIRTGTALNKSCSEICQSSNG